MYAGSFGWRVCGSMASWEVKVIGVYSLGDAETKSAAAWTKVI